MQHKNNFIHKAKTSRFVFVIYLIFIVTLGISYSWFSTTLQMNGVIAIEGYQWPDGQLPNLPVIDEGSDHYFSGTQLTDRMNVKSESWEGNTYNVVFGKSYQFGQIFQPATTFEWTIKIKNVSNYTYTDGTIDTSEERDTLIALSIDESSIDKSTLQPGEVVTFHIKFSLRVISTAREEIQSVLRYNVNGETREFIFNFKFEGA